MVPVTFPTSADLVSPVGSKINFASCPICSTVFERHAAEAPKGGQSATTTHR